MACLIFSVLRSMKKENCSRKSHQHAEAPQRAPTLTGPRPSEGPDPHRAPTPRSKVTDEVVVVATD